jgi:hypothetical protein
VPSRRDVLKYGVIGALVVAAGGAGLALRPTRAAIPAEALRVLDADEFSVLYAIAETCCPKNGAFPAASELHVAEKIDLLLSRCEDGTVSDIKKLLALVENALPGLVLDGRFSTFTASSPETRTAILEGWRTSRIGFRRTVFKALTGLVGATYYAQPEIWGAVGYPGPPNFGNFKGNAEAP